MNNFDYKNILNMFFYLNNLFILLKIRKAIF